MTSKEKLQQIYAKVEALKLSVERLSSEDETKDKPVEKKRAKYKGLALCHNETQTPLSEIFPSLPKNIEWTYVDLDNAGNNLIIANIYQTELFEKLTKQKASYDYIVMPFCIVYPPTRFNCVFPLFIDGAIS